MKYYSLTFHLLPENAKEIADRINSKHPGEATIKETRLGSIVQITETYWNYCKVYVLERCKIRPATKETPDVYLGRAREVISKTRRVL